MIQEETTSNISRLAELLAAHGVYALTIIFIFYQQWRAGNNLKVANPEDHVYFRKINTSVVITTYALVVISSAVWIYATFFYTAKFYIRGSVAGLTRRASSPAKPGGLPKIVEDISPESVDLNLYTKIKDAGTVDGKYDLGWVLFPPENMQSVVFVLQHQYEIVQQRKLLLEPASSPDAPETRAIEKKFKLDLRKLRYSLGSSIQLTYQEDPDDQTQKVGKIFWRNSDGALVCIPWEEIVPDNKPDKKTTRRTNPEGSWFLPAVYASSDKTTFKENGDYDPTLGRILKERLSDSDLRTQLLARDFLVDNGKRSFKFIRDTLKGGKESNKGILITNLAAAVQEIESDGSTAPRDINLALAKSFYDVGDNESSALFFDKAGDAPFDQNELYYYRAWAYYRTHQFDKSIKSLDQFIAKDQSPYTQAVARTVKGMDYKYLGHAPEAIKEYKNAMQLYPKLAIPYNALAYLYAERGDNLETALSLVNQALSLEINPDYVADDKDTKGWVLYKMGRCKEALPLLKEAAATLPTDLEIKKHLETLQNVKSCN
jgi:tetratricopeptide (TPR) repeat protein